MKIQIGQLAIDLKNCPRGVLLSDIEQPKRDDNKQCNVVTLRRGKTLPPAHTNDLHNNTESIDQE